MAHDGVREQGHNSGRATPDGVIVIEAFAMVLVSDIGLGLLLRCESLALCTCLTCSASSLALSSVVDK